MLRKFGRSESKSSISNKSEVTDSVMEEERSYEEENQSRKPKEENQSRKPKEENQSRKPKEEKVPDKERMSRALKRIEQSDSFFDDPLNFELYQKTLSHGVEKDRSIRVNVVGNYNQGKTSLTQALCRQDPTTFQSTNSLEIINCKYSRTNQSVQFCLKSSPSDETEMNRRLAALVQDEKHEKKPNQPKEKADTSLLNVENSNVFVDGKDRTSTVPKWNRQKPTSKDFLMVKELLRENQCDKSEEDGNIQIWDFGGQFIFYATHTLFHSKKSVYLMVFDLTKQLSDVIEDHEFPEESVGKNMQQYAEYWMNSIHSYVGTDDGLQPPVILVGTHKDKLEGDENMKEKIKDKYFDEIRKLFEDTLIINHIQTKDFAIDCTNANDKSIADLREEIVRLGSNFKETEVPARWIPLEKALLANKHKKIIPYNEVVAIDKQSECPLNDNENIRLFLLYHHAKGNLFYFDEGPISAYVAVDTQYLIDAFKCIITSERFCKKDPTYRHFWNNLRQKARLEMKLLDRVWSSDRDNDFLKHKNELLLFMQRHYIISEAVRYDEQTEKTQGLGWYVVPCFLRDHSSSDPLKELLSGKQTMLRFAMSFQVSPVVQIIYYRLIAALVGRWQVVSVGISKLEEKIMLYENLGAFRLDTHHVGIVERDQGVIDLRVICLCPSSSIKSPVVDMFRRFVVSNVMSEFRKLRHTNQKKPFEICFKCNHEIHSFDGSRRTVSVEQLEGEDVIPCPDIRSHQISTKKALTEWLQGNTNIALENDCQLEDRQLSKLSQAIGRNWELLGTELGLSTVQIDQISEDYNTAESRRFRMLLKWVAKKQENATFNTLIQAMKSTNELSVDWDEVRNIVEEIASKNKVYT